MRQLEKDMLTKWEIATFKIEVLAILHSLQFDGVYNTSHCINDLNSLLKSLDESETPFKLILSNNQDSIEINTKEHEGVLIT